MTDLFQTPNLSALTDRQLLERIYAMLSTAPNLKQVHKPFAGQQTPKRRHEYEPEFEELWKAYPARNGSNPKWKAQQCWRARIKEAAIEVNGGGKTEIENMLLGVRRYAAWCEATGKTGTEFVIQATRFLGPSKEYENAWDIPPPKIKVIRVPSELDALVKFGKEHGVATRYGESKWDYKSRVEAHLAQSET